MPKKQQEQTAPDVSKMLTADEVAAKEGKSKRYIHMIANRIPGSYQPYPGASWFFPPNYKIQDLPEKEPSLTAKAAAWYKAHPDETMRAAARKYSLNESVVSRYLSDKAKAEAKKKNAAKAAKNAKSKGKK